MNLPYYQSQRNEVETKRLLILGGVLLFLLALLTILSLYFARGKRIYENPILVEDSKENAFADIALQAKSAIVYDIVSGTAFYEKNAYTTLPLASLTKLVTAVTAVELLPETAVISIRQEFLEEEGDSGLYRDESWTFKDLLDFSLVVSSNDGSAAIASVAGALKTQSNPNTLSREAFIEEMNVSATKIGMEGARFFNESGLDIDEKQSGGYGSAHDMAVLLSYILREHPDVLAATRYEDLAFLSLDNIRHLAHNTNNDVSSIPGLLASKTGFTDLAGGNLAVVFDPGIGRPIVVVVLGSTVEGRFSDTRSLVEKTFEYLATMSATGQ